MRGKSRWGKESETDLVISENREDSRQINWWVSTLSLSRAEMLRGSRQGFTCKDLSAGKVSMKEQKEFP